MADSKLIEVRDHATFIPALAVRIGDEAREEDQFIRRRAGWSVGTIVLTNLSTMETHAALTEWSNHRTMPTIHKYLQNNWYDVVSGQVLDVAFIKGEADYIKLSERIDPLNERRGVPVE